MSKRVTRRELLRAGAGATATFFARPSRADAATAGMTHVFLRLHGGADGLSLIVPYEEPGYYRARPRIAIQRPSTRVDSAVALGPQFALHPCLGAWQALFAAEELGAVVGVGLSSRIASHRTAQRALDAAIIAATGDRAPEMPTGTLREQLRQVAASLKDRAPRSVLVASPGWDTHFAQGQGTRGRLAERANDLGAALLEFRAAIAPYRNRVRLAIVTEFGRTLSESPVHGTDDGYASIMFTFGTRQSGRVQGQYGPLQPGCPCSERARPPTLALESVLSRFVLAEPLI